MEKRTVVEPAGNSECDHILGVYGSDSPILLYESMKDGFIAVRARRYLNMQGGAAIIGLPDRDFLEHELFKIFKFCPICGVELK